MSPENLGPLTPESAKKLDHVSPEVGSGLSIETIIGPQGGEASYSPERGGIVRSIKLGGEEILYLDEETFQNKSSNVKGGIPILFPNAGPITTGQELPNLEQHGFARKSVWQTASASEGFRETLEANKETRVAYPYNFRFSMSGQFETNGSFTLKSEVENQEEHKELPLSMGLHPYFKVPSSAKAKIKFDFAGGEEIEKQIETWANGEAVSIDNPKMKDPAAVLRVEIPGLGTLVIDASAEYQKIWVWSLPDKDFVCIEPVMRNINGLIDNPEMIKPKETFSASVNFNLQK